MPDAADFLVRSARNVIGHCEHLLATSRSDDEREQLRRLVGQEEQFLASLAQSATADRLAT